ncbi:MAG: hypothetical protein EP330_15025 [Deltaproteobacteria bacterium]|nr:MAG: hypothetical protein EP330_15025 [Deltaproteobacteria bacterium]
MVLRRAVYGTLILLAGCGNPCAKGPGCVVAEALPPGLLSVRAPAADDVWVVGSSPEPDDGSGPALVHYDGEAWTREDTSAHAGRELWWLWVDGEDQVAVGDGGLILEGPPDARVPVSGISEAITFFGVWGASADEVWAVGMEPDVGPVLYRRQADAWTQVAASELPAAEPNDAYFKVEGTGASDVWVVGSGGLAMHYDGTTWTETPTDGEIETATAPLLTVSATGERPLLVGGFGNAIVLEWDGSTWLDASPSFQPGLNGVCASDSTAVAVGQRGARIQRIDGAWTPDEELLTDLDWHGCAVDDEGGVWSVGGRIGSRPLMQGVLAYAGDAKVPELVFE